jgi:hypothetical protein
MSTPSSHTRALAIDACLRISMVNAVWPSKLAAHRRGSSDVDAEWAA